MHDPNEIKTPMVIEEAREVRRMPELVESIADATDRATVGLRAGRILELDGSGPEDVITIKGTSGAVELAIRLTEDGPRLRFESAELELAATRDVRVRCERFTVEAKEDITHVAGGNLLQNIGGEAVIDVRGKLTTRSLETWIEARRGNVHVEANDDVRLLGERIKLNC